MVRQAVAGASLAGNPATKSPRTPGLSGRGQRGSSQPPDNNHRRSSGRRHVCAGAARATTAGGLQSRETVPMSNGSYTQFLSALGQNESGNNYGFVSSLGYLGRFQFGEE